jgi:hypothetical protein
LEVNGIHATKGVNLVLGASDVEGKFIGVSASPRHFKPIYRYAIVNVVPYLLKELREFLALAKKHKRTVYGRYLSIIVKLVELPNGVKGSPLHRREISSIPF